MSWPLLMEDSMKQRKLEVILGVIGLALLTSIIWSQEIPQGPPFKVVPCNMNCPDKWNIVPTPVSKDPALDQGTHRLFVLTDQGADNDDRQSMVRLLLYFDVIAIEGLVATTSTFFMDRTTTEFIEKNI